MKYDGMKGILVGFLLFFQNTHDRKKFDWSCKVMVNWIREAILKEMFYIAMTLMYPKQSR